MQVTKRDGATEPVDFNKILRSVERASAGLPTTVDPARIAKRVIDVIHDGVSTRQLDLQAVQEAAALAPLEPAYDKVATRVLAEVIAKEAGRDQSFWQGVERMYAQGSLRKDFRAWVKRNRKALEAAIDHGHDDRFGYFGLSVVYDRYLCRDVATGQVIERPQHWLMRVAVEAGKDVDDVLQAYQDMARGLYLHATPTLFNSGSPVPQLSSCYLNDFPDSIDGIFSTLHANANLSKFSGGIGSSVTRMRAKGSFIDSTKGASSGPIPFIKVADAAVKAVDQGGRRRGAGAWYMETWHADIVEFLELKDANGDENLRARNTWMANWVPDVFMQRAKDDGVWSLFDPADVPEFFNVHGDEFTRRYEAAEVAGKARRTMPAQELFGRMMRTLSGTGSGWMCFRDTSNRNHPQVEMSGTTVDGSNLCVHGDTWVFTSEGPRRAKDLVDTPFVAVVNGVEFPSTEKGFWRSGRKQVFKVTTKKGYSVVVSEDHPFLTKDGWAPLRDLKIGSVIALAKHAGEDGQTSWAGEGTREEGWLLGSLVGDGCFGMLGGEAVTANLDFWGSEKAYMVDFAKKLLEALPDSGSCKPYSQSDVEASDKVRLSSKRLLQLAKRFGLTCTANKHTVTEQIEKASSDFQRGFLAGLFDADGTVLGDQAAEIGAAVRLTSINLQMLQGVQRMLMRLGIESTLYQDRVLPGPRLLPDGRGGHRNYNCKASHDLNVARKSLEVFAARVAFASPLKSWKLGHTLASYKKALYRNTFEAEIANIEALGEDFVYDCTVPRAAEFDGNGIRLHNCTEILEVREVNDEKPELSEVAVCNLGSVNVHEFVSVDGSVNEDELRRVVKNLVARLDRIIDINYYPVPGARKQNEKWRNIGLGLMGLHDAFQKAGLAFESDEAMALSTKLSRIIWEAAVEASEELGAELGAFPAYVPVPSMPRPRRNSLLVAIAPTASIGSIVGVTECTEPRQANLFRRKTLTGEFVQVNAYLVNALKPLGLWSEQTLDDIIDHNGSVQALTYIPENVRAQFKTAWEISQRRLIDMAAERTPYIDQGQSTNLFMAEPHLGRMSSMYFHAWERGLKTTYYFKSLPASDNLRIKFGAAAASQEVPASEASPSVSDEVAIACSIENREACEVCQ